MKSSAYYFQVKAKILADFQICISVPLSSHYFKNQRRTFTLENDESKFKPIYVKIEARAHVFLQYCFLPGTVKVKK